jgi:hypothetical protein
VTLLQQTPRTFEVDASGEVLDRLVGLHQFIPPDLIRQAVLATGRRNRSDCRLTHEAMLRVVLATGILTDVSIRQVFEHARRLRKGEPTPPRNTLCKARRRLGVAPLRYLFEQVAQPLATPQTPGAFYEGLRLVGLDGTTYDIPDSPANVKAFGRPKGPRADAAFPQLRKLSLVELGAHAELAFVLKPFRRGEGAMVAGLMSHLHEGLLMGGPQLDQLADHSRLPGGPRPGRLPGGSLSAQRRPPAPGPGPSLPFPLLPVPSDANPVALARGAPGKDFPSPLSQVSLTEGVQKWDNTERG